MIFCTSMALPNTEVPYECYQVSPLSRRWEVKWGHWTAAAVTCMVSPEEPLVALRPSRLCPTQTPPILPAPNRKRLTICVNATRNTSTGKAPQKTSPRGRRHGHKAFSPSGDARNMWKSKDCSLMRDHWSVGSSVALAQAPEGQLMYEPWPEQSSPVSCEFSLVAKEVRGRAVCSVRSLMQTPSALAFLLFIEIYLQDKA